VLVDNGKDATGTGSAFGDVLIYVAYEITGHPRHCITAPFILSF
jgi:hypothetical protein